MTGEVDAFFNEELVPTLKYGYDVLVGASVGEEANGRVLHSLEFLERTTVSSGLQYSRWLEIKA